MSELKASAQKVRDALQALGLDHEVVQYPDSTRTAAEAAQAIGCEAAQIVKSLVFRTAKTNRPLLVLVSGVNRVDEKKLKVLIGEKIKKADAGFVREQTGFAIGGVPPLGHAQPLTTLIDQDLMSHEHVWAAAGTPNAVFRIEAKQTYREPRADRSAWCVEG